MLGESQTTGALTDAVIDWSQPTQRDIERTAELVKEIGMPDTASYHAPVTTLAELDALDDAELFAGHMSAEKGDPEPGANHTRSFHHGWRTRMMDLHEIEITPEHRRLTSEWVARNRAKEGSRKS